jgi:transposase
LGPLLEKKKRGEKAYYYAVWKKRVDGKVRKVKTVYLGTAETMMNTITAGGRNPLDVVDSLTLASRPFGGAALMLLMNELSGFTETCDRHLGADRADSSPGAYLFLTVANRLLHPTSKNGIEEWYRKGSALCWLDGDGADWMRRKRKRFGPSGQNIWNYMDMLTDEAMERIWNDVTARLRERLSIRDTTFFFDATNFFDYIDDGTNEEKGNGLPRKGYNKQHRSDKNQVSLSLFMGGESMMPYSHATYPGNIKDNAHFGDVVEDLKGFMKRFGRENVTLAMDKGCASEENVSKIRDYFFISTLMRDEAPEELLRMRLAECYEDGKGRTVCSASGIYEVKGVRAKVVCSFNESLRRKEERALRKELEKAEQLFRSKEGHAFRDEKAAYRFAERSLPRNFRRAIKYDVARSLDGEGCGLTWRRDEEAINQMRKREFGRNFIFTTRLDWSDERTIRSYRSLYKVENQFKLLRTSMLVPICPVRHWTDQKIEAHIFLCMVGLLFARAIEYMARTKGLTVPEEEGQPERAVSYARIIEAAQSVQLVMVLAGNGDGRRRGAREAAAEQIRFKLSNADDEFNRSILDSFDLRKFIPVAQK